MVKLTGEKKAKFLARMKKGKLKKSGKKTTKSAPKRALQEPKSVKVKRKSYSNNNNNMAKTKIRYRKAKSSIGGILNNSMLRKVMMGIGGGALAGTIVNMVAPQYTGIAKPLVALAVGGPIGAVASIVADGGLSSFSGLLSVGQSAGQSTGLSV